MKHFLIPALLIAFSFAANAQTTSSNLPVCKEIFIGGKLLSRAQKDANIQFLVKNYKYRNLAAQVTNGMPCLKMNLRDVAPIPNKPTISDDPLMPNAAK